MARTLFWLSICTWYMGSWWYVPDLHIEETGVKCLCRRWQLASCQHLLQISFQPGASWGVQGDGNHWFPHCQPDLWLIMVMWLEGYGPCFLHVCRMSSDFQLFGPLKRHLAGKLFVTWSRLSLPHDNTGYWFLLYWATSLVPWWDKCLNVSGDYMGGVICTICYSCAVCVLQGQNKIFDISVFVAYFLKLFYTCLLKYWSYAYFLWEL